MQIVLNLISQREQASQAPWDNEYGRSAADPRAKEPSVKAVLAKTQYADMLAAASALIVDAVTLFVAAVAMALWPTSMGRSFHVMF